MTFRMFDTTIGGLSCRVLDGTSDGDGELKGALLLCHGFGAPGDDLVPIAGEVLRERPELAKHVRFVFPAAPLQPPMLAGGRAWWELDMAALERAIQTGEERDLSGSVPDGLPAARKKLFGVVEELTQSSGLPLSRVVLGGFSQGSMLSCDVALRLEEAPAALVAFSGTLLSEDEWKTRAGRRAGLRVLQTHGREDPLLPFTQAERLRDMLSDAGLEVEFHAFDGGHGIPPVAIERLAALLVERLLD
jgi:phospholipase/carboxylesterase